MPFNPLSKRLLKNERKSIFYLMVLAGILVDVASNTYLPSLAWI
jgi:hypothetical protein